MYLFCERRIRGRICQCSNRYSKADEELLKSLWALDANNLNGYALSQKLPQKNFKWIDVDTTRSVEDILDKLYNTTIKSSRTKKVVLNNETVELETRIGYILEIDIKKFPEHLHNQFNDLPLAAESIIPPTPYSKVSKLLCHFNPKKNYIIHYRVLEMYMKLGLEVE